MQTRKHTLVSRHSELRACRATKTELLNDFKELGSRQQTSAQQRPVSYETTSRRKRPRESEDYLDVVLGLATLISQTDNRTKKQSEPSQVTGRVEVWSVQMEAYMRWLQAYSKFISPYFPQVFLPLHTLPRSPPKNKLSKKMDMKRHLVADARQDS